MIDLGSTMNAQPATRPASSSSTQRGSSAAGPWGRCPFPSSACTGVCLLTYRGPGRVPGSPVMRRMVLGYQLVRVTDGEAGAGQLPSLP
jgi:hypothetical protein